MGGLLTYTVPKTVSGIQRVGTALKEQYPKYQEKVEKIIEEYGDTEIGIFLKSKLQIETIKEEEIKDGKSQEQEVKEVTTKESDGAKYSIPEPVLKMKKYVPASFELCAGDRKKYILQYIWLLWNSYERCGVWGCYGISPEGF